MLQHKQNFLLSLPLLATVLLASAPALASLPESANTVARGLAPAKNQSVNILQPYQGEFRILGRKDYQADREARFSPMDFAVSEGMLASKRYYPLIGVKQDNRYLTWDVKYLPLPADRMKELVSNIHIIPASPQIADLLKKVKPGDLVRMHGDLVEVDDNGWTWKSSLSRDDVGDGACELMRVSAIEWVEKT